MNSRAQLISQAALARLLGVSRQAVNHYVAAGLPLHEGKVDRAEARAWIKENIARGARAPGSETFGVARIRKESAVASLRELELQLTRREVVWRKDVESAYEKAVTEARYQLLNLADEVTPRLIGISDASEIRALVDNAIREALTPLSRPLLLPDRGGKPEDHLKPIVLLLVEDNPGDILLIRQVLVGEKFPIKVHVAVDGEQALLMLQDLEPKPDLVILDLNLPKVPGLSFLARCPGGVLSVVFSSSSKPEDSRRSLELGAREFVRKPSDLSEFAKEVSRIVRKWSNPESMATSV